MRDNDMHIYHKNRSKTASKKFPERSIMYGSQKEPAQLIGLMI